MANLTSSLGIGLSGLQVAQESMSVIGHNIANINTPGYSQQSAVLSTNPSQAFGNLEFGTGAGSQLTPEYSLYFTTGFQRRWVFGVEPALDDRDGAVVRDAADHRAGEAPAGAHLHHLGPHVGSHDRDHLEFSGGSRGGPRPDPGQRGPGRPCQWLRSHRPLL